MAADHDTLAWARTSSLEALQRFVNHPDTDVNQQNGNGKALLHEVVADQNGWEKLTYLLSRSGIVIDIKQNDGTTPLYQAALGGNLAAVTTLLQHPVDVNNRNADNQWTILMVAVAQDHAEIVERLLGHPAVDVNAQGDRGDTALQIACGRGHERCTALLLGHQAINVNLKNTNGWTPLTTATLRHDLAIMRMLWYRPDLEVNFVDRNRQTALHWAVIAGHLDSVRLLLARPDINVGITDRPAHHTAQDLAEAAGQTEIARALKEKAQSGYSEDALSANDHYDPRPAPPPDGPQGPAIADPPMRGRD